MEIAIIYKDDQVYVRFSEEKFRQLFKLYFDEYKNVDKTFDEIVKDIKKETLNR